MKPSRLRAACATFVVLGLPLATAAGPGDPRLVSGAVEWPAVLTNEPFVIVRGNDGAAYYVTLAATRREGTVSAGTHVSVLGLEGRHRHEITAVGIGTGPTAEIALAQLQEVRPIAAQSPKTADPAVSAPAPAAVAAAQAPKAPTGQPAPVPDPVALVTPLPIIATTPKIIGNDNARWVEIVGEVETIAGGTLVLKVDGGRVSVDVSGLRTNLERSLVPGTKLKIYGVPVEDRFKAMGFIEPDARPRGPRKN
jgi:hypothetical protein